MSGKNQHFLPRFLQKGFKYRSTPKSDFVWFYRKGQKPISPNINNSGAEGYFYTEAEYTAVDDKITDIENEFAPFIDNVRNHSSIRPEYTPKIAELLAHLETRTRHLRETFIESGSFIVNGIFDFLDDKA